MTDGKSNGDVIRGMSDTELAKFLLAVEEGDIDFSKTFCDLCCKDAALEGREESQCDGCVLWWVKCNSKHPQGLKQWYEGQ